MTVMLFLANDLSNSSISTLNAFYDPALTTTAHSAIVVMLFRVFVFSSFYYVGLFHPFGIIFNLFLLIVFGISPLGTTKTTRVYYLAMAYEELGTVLFKDGYYFWGSLGLPFITGGFNPLGPINPLSTIGNFNWACGLHSFLWFTHEIFSNNVFLLFELERVVAVYAPLRVRHIFTYRKTLLMVR